MRDSAKAAKATKSDTEAQTASTTGADSVGKNGGTKGDVTAVKKKTKPAADQIDPLYVIFEQHLFNFQDSDADRKTFIGNIIAEYLGYLRKMNIVVPKSLEQPIIEELASQVNTMLVKKIYGCLSIQDYQRGIPTTVKRRARNRYAKIVK